MLIFFHIFLVLCGAWILHTLLLTVACASAAILVAGGVKAVAEGENHRASLVVVVQIRRVAVAVVPALGIVLAEYVIYTKAHHKPVFGPRFLHIGIEYGRGVYVAEVAVV